MMMKLIICIVQNEDSSVLQDELVKNGVQATKLSSTGGFLKSGNTTLLIGTEEENVSMVMSIIEKNCGRRTQVTMSDPTFDHMLEYDFRYPINIDVGGATVFVVDIDQFKKF